MFKVEVIAESALSAAQPLRPSNSNDSRQFLRFKIGDARFLDVCYTKEEQMASGGQGTTCLCFALKFFCPALFSRFCHCVAESRSVGPCSYQDETRDNGFSAFGAAYAFLLAGAVFEAGSELGR